MGFPATVVGYAVRFLEGKEFHTTSRSGTRPQTEMGYQYFTSANGTHGSSPTLAYLWSTADDASAFALLDGVKNPDRLGRYSVCAVVAGFSIKGRVRAKKNSYHSSELETIEGFFNADGGFVTTLEEASKYRTREIAETLAFNMTIKNPDLLGTVEVVQVNHVQEV